MIDWILEMIGAIIPWLHLLAIIGVTFKAILVFQNKGFNLPAVFPVFPDIFPKRSFDDRKCRQAPLYEMEQPD